MELRAEKIVILTGVGKSAIVAELGASLLASVGVRAVAVHATDLLHGSLGLLREGGTLIAITHSGRTPEILAALHAARQLHDSVRGIFVRTTAITGCSDNDDYTALSRVCGNISGQGLYGYTIPFDGSNHGTIPILSVQHQLSFINDWVVQIANSMTPDELQAYHPSGALAGRYQEEKEQWN